MGGFVEQMKLMLVLDICVPFTIVIAFMAMITQMETMPPTESQICHKREQPLPSSGTFPFLKGLTCFSGFACYDNSQSKVTDLDYSEGLDDTLSDKLIKLVNSPKVASVISEVKVFLKFFKNEFQLKALDMHKFHEALMGFETSEDEEHFIGDFLVRGWRLSGLAGEMANSKFRPMKLLTELYSKQFPSDNKNRRTVAGMLYHRICVESGSKILADSDVQTKLCTFETRKAGRMNPEIYKLWDKISGFVS
ncbi:hypothetical protein HELRODRAFT_181934 [Helobdella robusta]|uniref:Uncharacterized protein n=1 Tax=Helobdella robusta TaxID=6412 RepID=T1FHH0_HELRO|nr:hypothetical protein HELRODRAFT_181934 [Helobdella robusta]ESN92005.1 hypothetical protein HELRODRAFT_181934 [Helobdella robusta]